MIKVTKRIEDMEVSIETDAELTKENLTLISNELFGVKEYDLAKELGLDESHRQ